MPRDFGINIYHECDITDWCVDMSSLMTWCEQHLEGGWNVVADSGTAAARGSGEHYVIFLCAELSDITQFRMSWQP